MGKPFKSRKGETVGGGFFVFRRGETSKRILFKAKRNGEVIRPFEHGSLRAAIEEAQRLEADAFNGQFVILQQVAAVDIRKKHPPGNGAGGHKGGHRNGHSEDSEENSQESRKKSSGEEKGEVTLQQAPPA
jgi:hypothetical protein